VQLDKLVNEGLA
jgi:tetratricopeptide (TPR) repeat protein